MLYNYKLIVCYFGFRLCIMESKKSKYLKKAEETSNLDFDQEIRKNKRKIKIKRVYVSEPSDDSNSSNDCPTLKKTRTRLTNMKKEYSEYPTPPKRKAVGKNTVTKNLSETQLSEDFPVITDPRSLPCTRDGEIYTNGINLIFMFMLNISLDASYIILNTFCR